MNGNKFPIYKSGGLLLLLLILVGRGGPVHADMQSMPKQIGAWKADGKDQVFDRETIFKYIDGGAELYLAYDFRQVLSSKYK